MFVIIHADKWTLRLTYVPYRGLGLILHLSAWGLLWSMWYRDRFLFGYFGAVLSILFH